jgi:hypothetical protein
MSLPDLCPGCLAELPADYPFDHVRIDRALAGGRAMFRSMEADEQREVIRTGRERGLSDSAMARAFGLSHTGIHTLMGDERRTEVDDQVRVLWESEFNDSVIGMRLGIHPGTVNKIRTRLGLASLYGPGGRRRTGVAA